ncbi:MAG: AAA family ATPase [Mycobacterium sp.]
MILHRVRLTNFRGVADREIVFPQTGVVVVCGPNEVGKSSVLEALDLLLEHKDRSTRHKVMSVKPTHADVGAEVEAEISTGPYRFVYRKRFHKKHRTELTLIAPARAQLSGDEAHEKVHAMLAETVDTKLWEAQRVLQSAATGAVDLSGCDALSRALDAAAGAVAAPSGAESLLIDRIDAEFERYYTPAAGRPAREYKEAIAARQDAEREAQRCRDAVADVEERVAEHERLSSVRRELAAQLGPAATRFTAAQQAQAAVQALAEQWSQARLVAEAAAATGAAAASALALRAKLKADFDRRAAAVADLAPSLASAVAEQAAAQQSAEAAVLARDQAEARVSAARELLDAAQAAAAACEAREQAVRLATRVERIDDTQRRLQEMQDHLAGLTLTDEVLTEIEQSCALVTQLEAQLNSDAGTVELTAAADLELTVDGEPLVLAAGQSWTVPPSVPLTVALPDVLSVRVDPGAGTAALRVQLQDATQARTHALARGGVAGLASARRVAEQRRSLVGSCAELSATLAALCLGEDAEDLRTRLAQLRAASSGPEIDAAAAAAASRSAQEALDQARADAEARQLSLTAATGALTEKCTAVTLATERHRCAEAELTGVRELLHASRAAASDEAVAAAAQAAAEAQRRTAETAAALAERVEAANPSQVEAELAAATNARDLITGELAAVEKDLDALSAQLEVIGTEGRQGQLDEAESELERVRAEHDRVAARAHAAKLLRETMARHRDDTRQRYVRPYRAELERLGRVVFGSSFEVEIDTDLVIRSRTLDGKTVPYESLSGGAKEQLGILARLAGAALVSADDTVPVVIDDALGFSDPDRLTRMGTVFSTVGDRGQVIVLTCQPSRYRGIAQAEVIELSA